jgi:hypothetical protein
LVDGARSFLFHDTHRSSGTDPAGGHVRIAGWSEKLSDPKEEETQPEKTRPLLMKEKEK